MSKRSILALIVCLAVAPFCLADSLKDRIAIHLAAGLYESQDMQGGGFRFGGGVFGGGGQGGEREVEIDNGMRWEAGITLGLFDTKSVHVRDAEGKKTGEREQKDRMSLIALELEVSYFKEGIGAEAAFKDPDASALQRVPVGTFRLPVGASGDEEQVALTIGEITIVPVAVNVLWHFGFRRGKTSTYAGGGPAYVFTDWDTSRLYREFAGYDDGRIKDGPGLNLKGGLQVWLSENWVFDFHANYLIAKEQFHWNGVKTTFGDQAFDTDGNDVPDLFGQPADFRYIQPGNLRLDGLALSVGMRYAFPAFKRGGSS